MKFLALYQQWNELSVPLAIDWLKRFVSKLSAVLSTPWAIKTVPLFLIITLAFLGRFLYCLYQWKQEGIPYKAADKIYHFTLTVSLYNLVNLKRHINSTFWSQSLQCVRSSSQLCNFHRKSSNVRPFQFLVGHSYISLIIRTFSHSHRFFFDQNFRPIFKLNVFNFEKLLYEVNSCEVWCDALMMSLSH